MADIQMSVNIQLEPEAQEFVALVQFDYLFKLLIDK